MFLNLVASHQQNQKSKFKHQTLELADDKAWASICDKVFFCCSSRRSKDSLNRMPSEDFFDIARKARALDESCLDEEIQKNIELREESRKSIRERDSIECTQNS